MWRLLLIYLVVMIVPRILKGLAESQKTAPRRRVSGPNFEEFDVEGLDLEAGEEQPRPRQVVLRSPRRQGGQPSPSSEGEPKQPQEVLSESPREKKLAKMPDEKTTGESLGGEQPLGQSSWVQGVVMAEILAPPRARRPWGA